MGTLILVVRSCCGWVLVVHFHYHRYNNFMLWSGPLKCDWILNLSWDLIWAKCLKWVLVAFHLRWELKAFCLNWALMATHGSQEEQIPLVVHLPLLYVFPFILIRILTLSIVSLMGHFHIFILVLHWVKYQVSHLAFLHYFTHLVKTSCKVLKWFKMHLQWLLCDFQIESNLWWSYSQSCAWNVCMTIVGWWVTTRLKTLIMFKLISWQMKI